MITDKKITNEMIDSLIDFAGEKIMNEEFVFASVLNENEQPIILSSSEDGETFHLTVDGKNTLEMPSKMIPYLTFALTKMYLKSLGSVYKGDKSKIKNHLESIKEEIKDIEFFNLKKENSLDEECTCGSATCPDSQPETEPTEPVESELDEIEEALNRVQIKSTEKMVNNDLGVEEAEELLKDLNSLMKKTKASTEEISEEYMDKVKSGEVQGFDVNALESIKEKHDKELLQSIKDIEEKLNGKPKKEESKIGLDKIKEVFMKYGPQAAKEELAKVPQEDRAAIMHQIIDDITKK